MKKSISILLIAALIAVSVSAINSESVQAQTQCDGAHVDEWYINGNWHVVCFFPPQVVFFNGVPRICTFTAYFINGRLIGTPQFHCSSGL